MRSDLNRREFLRNGALVGAGLGLLPSLALGAEPPPAPPRVRRYAPLGRTGLEISDISFGASRLRGDEDLVRHAFDAGINYFDTAESYTDGQSETTIGRALRGRRDRCHLTSKVVALPGQRRGELMRTLEGSLRRLQTDHVDVYFNHAVNDVARLKNPEWPEFVADAKRQGKIRFSGMSGHAGRLVECLDYALDHDQVDVILVAHNFGQDPAFYQRFLKSFDFVAVQPDLPRVLAKAHAKGVGVVAMKTLMGARLNDMRPWEVGDATFAQAAFRWVLSNPDVDALIVSMTSREQIDEYLGASGWERPKAADLPLLGGYLARNGGDYCRHACGACESACPAGVPVGEVLRTRMYARDYGDVDLARREYAALGTNAAACLSCTARPCAGACPHGLAPETLGAETHRLLAG
jgi:predicted aldo/keto reductase-like oxidoreductase